MIEDLGSRVRTVLLAILLGALTVYRWILSPLLLATNGPACRFQPTCSEYAHQALTIHGLGRGLCLTIRRLARCRPKGGWGYDPVPVYAEPDLKRP